MNALQQKQLLDLHVSATDFRMAEAMSPNVLDRFIANRAVRIGEDEGRFPSWIRATPSMAADLIPKSATLADRMAEAHAALDDEDATANALQAMHEVGVPLRAGAFKMNSPRADVEALEMLGIDLAFLQSTGDPVDALHEAGVVLAGDGPIPCGDSAAADSVSPVDAMRQAGVPVRETAPAREDGSGRFASASVATWDPVVLRVNPSQAAQALRDQGRLRVQGHGPLSAAAAQDLVDRVPGASVARLTIDGQPVHELKATTADPEQDDDDGQPFEAESPSAALSAAGVPTKEAR